MPKETYFNLSEEKRRKIENALKNEFGRVSFSKASISNIVNEAKIPRGSFYQYFEDKEDAVMYVLKRYIEEEKGQIETLLKETNGDIFETSIKIFDYAVENEKEEKERKLFKNILEELRKDNINWFEKEHSKRHNHNFYSLINKEDLKLHDEEDLRYIMYIISGVTRICIMDVISKKRTKEEGRNDLVRQFEILKRGISK